MSHALRGFTSPGQQHFSFGASEAHYEICSETRRRHRGRSRAAIHAGPPSQPRASPAPARRPVTLTCSVNREQLKGMQLNVVRKGTEGNIRSKTSVGLKRRRTDVMSTYRRLIYVKYWWIQSFLIPIKQMLNVGIFHFVLR